MRAIRPYYVFNIHFRNIKNGFKAFPYPKIQFRTSHTSLRKIRTILRKLCTFFTKICTFCFKELGSKYLFEEYWEWI